jgi:hypothetical protein
VQTIIRRQVDHPFSENYGPFQDSHHISMQNANDIGERSNFPIAYEYASIALASTWI